MFFLRIHGDCGPFEIKAIAEFNNIISEDNYCTFSEDIAKT